MVEGGDETVLGEHVLRPVSELSTDIERVIEDSVSLSQAFVLGEVVDAGVSRGTLYFQLSDDDASIQCVMFNSARESLDVELEDGMEVGVAGELSYYQPRGRCSIIVSDIELLGDGAYQQELEQRREELAAEGLFESERKQPMPRIPTTIGLVTAAGSDAQEDTIQALHGRFPGVEIRVMNASVQGEYAADELIPAIERVDAAGCEVLIVTRGGGSDEDLRVFNEESVVRAVAETDTPVVVAIGHETDRTLAGAAADERAMTPTDTAEYAVADRAALESSYAAVERRVQDAFMNTVSETVQEYEATVEAAVSDVVREREHEQEIQATETRYRVVVAVLVLVLVVLAVWVLVL